jgi:drug/metabolite transporter (DMT)-like permease
MEHPVILTPPPQDTPGNHLTSTWLKLSPNLRGIVWILIGTILFSMTDVMVKQLGRKFDPLELSFFRYLMGFLILAPVFIGMGVKNLKTKRIGIHFLRLVLAAAAQVGVFYSVINLPLADATAFYFTKPLFTTIVAVIILSEIVSKRRWVATAVGFVGVLVMVRPGVEAIHPAAFVAIASALTFAIGNVLIRVMAKTEPPNRILFYYHIGGLLIFLPPAIWVWRTPVGIEWFLLAAIGSLTTAAMVCFVRAYTIGEANVVGSVEYIRLIYAAAFGYFIFAEIPSPWTVAGAAIIVISTIYITRDEARRGKTK